MSLEVFKDIMNLIEKYIIIKSYDFNKCMKILIKKQGAFLANVIFCSSLIKEWFPYKTCFESVLAF